MTRTSTLHTTRAGHPDEDTSHDHGCQIGLSPQCEVPEVILDCPPHFTKARCCTPCGKAFQTKFTLASHGMTLRPIEGTNND
jgi:hypothetical protein